MPIRIKVHEAMNAGTAQRMKSKFAPRMRCSMFSDRIRFFSNNQSKIRRVTTSAVNMLARMPIVNETPNPFTGPVPRKIRMTEEMSVVRLESRIVPNALL